MADKRLKLKVRKDSEYGVIATICIALILLKLTDNIKWNWLAILSPVWGYIVVKIASIILYTLMIRYKKY